MSRAALEAVSEHDRYLLQPTKNQSWLFANLTVLFHLVHHAFRIARVLHEFNCLTPHELGMLDVAFQVSPVEMKNCSIACRNSTIHCRCVKAQVWPQLQHFNLAQHATGNRDLLFAHGDMWLNWPWLRASRWLSDGSMSITPRRGLDVIKVAPNAQTVNVETAPRHTGAVCLPITMASQCERINATRCGFARRNCSLIRCGDTVWGYDFGSFHSFPIAVHKENLTEWCIGWSDLIFLPRRAQARFRDLARGAFREVFHEVAIPTILNALSTTGCRWAPALDCLGSCCQNLNPRHLRQNMSHIPCAHRVPLGLMRDADMQGICS